MDGCRLFGDWVIDKIEHRFANKYNLHNLNNLFHILGRNSSKINTTSSRQVNLISPVEQKQCNELDNNDTGYKIWIDYRCDEYTQQDAALEGDIVCGFFVEIVGLLLSQFVLVIPEKFWDSFWEFVKVEKLQDEDCGKIRECKD